jgi:hypothetical protein
MVREQAKGLARFVNRRLKVGIGAIVAAAVLLGVALHPQHASADGALAVGLPKDVAKQGFAYAYSTDKADSAAARAEALETCRKPGDNKSAVARGLCSVIGTFTKQCVAVAMDPANGTPGVGWAIAYSLQSAESAAMAKCEATAGADRKGQCKVDHSRCEASVK